MAQPYKKSVKPYVRAVHMLDIVITVCRPNVTGAVNATGTIE
jgi:hypothetical protein